MINRDHIHYWAILGLQGKYAADLIENCKLERKENQKNNSACEKHYNPNLRGLLTVTENNVRMEQNFIFYSFTPTTVSPIPSNSQAQVIVKANIVLDPEKEHHLTFFPGLWADDPGRPGPETFSKLQMIVNKHYVVSTYGGGVSGYRENSTEINNIFIPLENNFSYKLSLRVRTPLDSVMERLKIAPQSLKYALSKKRLSSLLYVSEKTFFSIIAILLTAFVLGMLHALSPGHGKAIISAYLITSRDRIRDSFLLGTIVTLTHVSSVFFLGLIYFAFSQYLLPETVIPIMESVSGFLVLIVGLYLIYRHFPRKGHPHHNHHTDTRVQRLIGEKFSLTGLIMLGISGGIVPCPSALAILLISISIGRVLLGLTLIVAFSIGLSCTLIILGILVTKATSIVEKFYEKKSIIKILPLISAILISLVGVFLLVKSLRI